MSAESHRLGNAPGFVEIYFARVDGLGPGETGDQIRDGAIAVVPVRRRRAGVLRILSEKWPPGFGGVTGLLSS